MEKSKKKKEKSMSFSRKMDTQIQVYLYSSIFITQKTSNKLLIIKVKVHADFFKCFVAT